MNARDLKPASQLAQCYGVKSVIYGGPGSGKTPLINTAPNPVMLVCEPGLLSMRGSNVPCFEGYTVKAIKEFFKWLYSSSEVKKFDTLVIDSVSQLAEIILIDKLKTIKHGQKAFGEMNNEVMEYASWLFYLKQKHVVLLAKEAVIQKDVMVFVNNQPTVQTLNKRQPYFPGKELNIKIPHLFDEILHADKATVPGQNGEQRVLQSLEAKDLMARDRSGKLDPMEPHDLTYLFNKIIS